jgi:CCR4-NOT transcription complex subunit 7/8
LYFFQISLPGLTFFKMTEMFFEDAIDDSKYLGHLYGLGTSWGSGTEQGSTSPLLLTPTTNTNHNDQEHEDAIE